MQSEETLVAVRSLKKYYPVLGGVLRRRVADVKAVDQVSIDIIKGECFGLVGESGCGKTTIGKTIIRLYNPTSGHVYFNAPQDALKEIESLETEIARRTAPVSELTKKREAPGDSKVTEEQRTKAKKQLSEDKRHAEQQLVQMKRTLKELRSKYDIASYRGPALRALRRKMQIVYQDPTTSLNPRMTIKDIVGEPLKVQNVAAGVRARARVIEMLEKVGMSERHMFRYPHEFSGGQRQRIAIARALVSHPEFVVLDEPTSAVDVSVRAQLLDLFKQLQKELGLTYMFVSHDLSVVEVISHRVGVMYLGKIVELADTKEIFQNPLHPYTQALFSSIPKPDPTKRRKRAALKGEVPSPINPPSGCRFHPRCSLATSICQQKEPELVDIGKGHFVACHVISEKFATAA